MGRFMRRIIFPIFVLGLLVWPVTAQEESPDLQPVEVKKEKTRPPRIPDAPFVPKRGMVKRDKGEFWAGPPDEGRFGQILSLTLVPREKLQEKLGEWPNYQQLSVEQRERLMERIDQVRESARKQALEVAKEFGLQVEPGQEEVFVRMYWSERVRMDQALRKEMEGKRKKLEEESQARILEKFPRLSAP